MCWFHWELMVCCVLVCLWCEGDLLVTCSVKPLVPSIAASWDPFSCLNPGLVYVGELWVEVGVGPGLLRGLGSVSHTTGKNSLSVAHKC